MTPTCALRQCGVPAGVSYLCTLTLRVCGNAAPPTRVGATLGTVLAAIALTGCVHYRAQPLVAAKVAADYESRSFADAGLRGFLETNHVTGEWPRRVWDVESLTLAAFYFSPELDLARAQWGTAQAGLRTAGQRPNPTVTASPQYNTTTLTPSPWVMALSLDIPIETAGKRGYRLAHWLDH